MKRLHTAFVIILSLALAGSAWAAQGKGRSQAKGTKPEAAGEAQKGKPEAKGGKPDKPGHGPGLPAGEADKIRVWLRSNRSGLPPGLAKREELPPGLQKHLIKNGVLPPGLQKKIQPLPRALEVTLVPLPVGYRRYVIGGQLILVEVNTFRIVDLVPDIIVVIR